MTDLNVQLILKLVDRATAPARAALAGINRLGAGVMARAQAAQTQAVALGSALGGAAGAATRTGLALGLLGGLSLRSFTNQAAEFERFTVQLTNLEGSSEGASRALAWIEDFATRTPLQVDQTVAAYTRLKAFGIDPTNGTLQALVDTMAATGGSAEMLDGLVLALGQSWTKGKLQGEEALQMLERGVPVYDLLAKKLGVTTEEVIAMQGAGELGREEIALLIEALGEANDGAAEEMSKTWDGIISNLWDHWGRFSRQVMASDLFAWMKARLVELLDTLNRLAADGTLLRWAQDTAAVVIRVFEGIAGFVRGAIDLWNRWSPTIDAVTVALGGAEGTIAALIALRFAPWIIAVGRALGGLLFALGPLGWALGLIALAATAIYEKWDGFVQYFQDKIDRVKAAFDDGLIKGVFAALMEFNPFVVAMDGASALFDYITGWTFVEAAQALHDAFMNIDLYAAGVALMNSLWEGMKSVMGQITAWASAQLSSIAPDWLTAEDQRFNGGNLAMRQYPGSPDFINADGSVGMAQPSSGPDGRATGGPVRAGMIYRWQEQGEEFFRPRVDGTVINARGTAEMRRDGGARVLNLGGITINAAPGMSPDAIARAVRREIARLAEGAGTELHDGGLYAR